MAINAFLTESVTYLGAAVVSVPIAKRLGLGSVLGYLLAGIAIGPFGLELIGSAEGVREVSEFGIVMMLFLIGLELQPKHLWDMRGAVFGLGSAQIVATALCGAGATYLLGLPPAPAIATGLVLAMSSTAIVLQSLTERRQLQTTAGETSFAILLLQDISVVPILALIAALSPAMRAGGQTEGLLATLPVWAQAIAVPAAIATLVLVGRVVVGPLFRLIARTRLREIFTASALLIVTGAALLMAAVGLSPALGAFLGGVVLADSEFRHELEGDIEPFKGLLLGLFFISVGAHIDLSLLAREPILVGALVAGAVLLKAAVLTVVLKSVRVPWRDALMVALALSQIGEFAFVLTQFGGQTGVFKPEIAALINLVVALSMVTTPPILTLLDFLFLRRTTQALEREPDVIEERRQIIIAGFGRIGQIVGRLLIARGLSVTVLEVDEEQLATLARFGFKTYYGDARREAILRAAGADEASVLIVATDGKENTLEIVEMAKKSFPRLRIVARAFDRGHAYALEAVGADIAVRETFDSAVQMGTETLKRLGYPAYEAERLGRLFRRLDRAGYEAHRALIDNEESYVIATREHRAQLERVLTRDALTRDVDGDGAWDTDSLASEAGESTVTSDT